MLRRRSHAIQTLAAVAAGVIAGLVAAGSAGAQTPAKADHTKFPTLQGPFATGPDVTKACLTCHTDSAKQVQRSLHWTWDYTNPITGQKLGKRNVINNFCGSLATNEPRCTSCHVGFGWKDAKFDFTQETNVDCVICHEQTGTYRKFPTDAGHPNYEPKKFGGRDFPVADLAKVAQSVALPGRRNCGACHFFSGGGDAVKHGDLDSSLTNPDRNLDVHMAKEGLNFACSTCHETKQHITSGSRFTTKAAYNAAEPTGANCGTCHGTTPHKSPQAATLDKHATRVACQTCHIPEFARVKATKTLWDWSTAGQLKDSKPFVVKDEKGNDIFDSLKGTFEWEANVRPTYMWFNGEIKYTLQDQKIDDTKVVPINVIGGSATDGKSRIWPFKIMRGRQPYDTVNKTLLLNHVFGKDDSAFWGNFNWEKSLAFAMKDAGLPYSGKFAFVDSTYAWPITHMVAPKERALSCNECHTPNGRMKDVPGLRMPTFN